MFNGAFGRSLGGIINWSAVNTTAVQTVTVVGGLYTILQVLHFAEVKATVDAIRPVVNDTQAELGGMAVDIAILNHKMKYNTQLLSAIAKELKVPPPAEDE